MTIYSPPTHALQLLLPKPKCHISIQHLDRLFLPRWRMGNLKADATKPFTLFRAPIHIYKRDYTLNPKPYLTTKFYLLKGDHILELDAALEHCSLPGQAGNIQRASFASQNPNPDPCDMLVSSSFTCDSHAVKGTLSRFTAVPALNPPKGPRT